MDEEFNDFAWEQIKSYDAILFGFECFLNEIIWAYDYGGLSKDRLPAKHDNILLVVKDPEHYTFNRDAVERIPYMAPGLVGEEKATLGKLPSDTLWRIVSASSNPGDVVLDFFAGSGTTGAACLEVGRQFMLEDDNPQSIDMMHERFAGVIDLEWS